MNLIEIPKLDELAETPAKAKDLPPDVRQGLAFRALTVLNALHAAGLADGANSNGQAEHTVNGDRLLDVKKTAAKLTMSKNYPMGSWFASVRPAGPRARQLSS